MRMAPKSILRMVLPAVFAALVLTLLPSSAYAASAAPKSYTNVMFRLAHPSGLEKYARSVSTPGSPRYRRYRSVKWAVERFGAKPKTKRRVLRWLAGRGVRGEVDASGTSVLATASPGQAEALLEPGASISAARGGASGNVPPELRGEVVSVSFLDTDPDKYQPQTAFPPQPAGSVLPEGSSARPHSGSPAGCAEGIAAGVIPGYGPFTPNQYNEAYGFSKLQDQGFQGQGMRMAVVETDGFKRSDLETYGKCFDLRIPPTPVSLVGIKKPLAPGAETTLDLSVISAVAPKLKRIDVYEGGSSEQGIMKSVGAALGRPGARPDAISISLGLCEQGLTGAIQYRRGMQNLFAVAAVAGISTFVAAGDSGAAACTFNGNVLGISSVSDPASSPWVTAVGGTNLVLNENNTIADEFVWNDGSLGPSGGGGGLSILATQRPWYQRGKAFKGAGLTRAVPDVAALADSYPGYPLYCTAAGPGSECTSQTQPAGGFQSIGGTSAASPLTAAGFVLLAQKARKAGQAPIGFANPLLYAIGSSKARSRVFRDVVAGNNDVGMAIPAAANGAQPLGCCSASKGYDPASGWGSIKAMGLAEVSARYAPGRR